MKKTVKWVVFVVIVALFGFGLATCTLPNLSLKPSNNCRKNPCSNLDDDYCYRKNCTLKRKTSEYSFSGYVFSDCKCKW